jgi:phospholipid/cholesterol/gamma-HCH transport system substrate-binding protein
METRAHFAMIGAFTLAVIAAAFMFVFWFSGARTREGVKTYNVVFTSSVSGLSRGARVLFNGLNVGEVKKIDLLPNDPGKVFATIEVNANTPVKTDTRARLESQGLTGVASIALIGGTAGAKDLPGDAAKPPVIAAEQSEIQNILDTLQRLTGKVDSAMTQVEKLISANADSISKTIKNVETFSEALSKNSGGVQQFMASISELGKTLKPMVSNMEQLTKNLNERVAAIEPEKLKSIVENADKIASNFVTSAEKFNKLVADNSPAINETVKNAKTFSEALAGNTGNLKSAMTALADIGKTIKPVIDSLQTVTKNIDERIKAVDPEKVTSLVANADKAAARIAGSIEKFDKFFDTNSKPLTETVRNVQGFSETLASNKDGVNKLIVSLSNLGKTLEPAVKNFETITKDISTRVAAVDEKKLKEIVDNAQSISAKLVGSADKLDKVLTSADKLLGSGDSKGAIAEVSAAAKAIRVLAQNLDARTKVMSRGINRFTGAGLRQYEALAADGRRTLRQLDRTIQSLKKNPQQVIFGAKPSIPEYSGR